MIFHRRLLPVAEESTGAGGWWNAKEHYGEKAAI
jgi:hypothetical protein